MASISVQLFYDLGWESAGLAVSALLGIALGVAAHWLHWSVPGAEALAPVDSYFTRVKRKVGEKLPPVVSGGETATTMVSAPTRKDVRDELDRLGVSGAVSQEQFVEALYRVYVDDQGSGLR